jgi:hypothetical protein
MLSFRVIVILPRNVSNFLDALGRCRWGLALLVLEGAADRILFDDDER